MAAVCHPAKEDQKIDVATRPKLERSVICVDLDGTLILSDLAGELTLRLLRSRPTTVFKALAALVAGGRAQFKRALTENVPFDPSLLPYREDLVEWLREQSARGAYLVLATATDEAAAMRVANHLGIFDEVIASDGKRNLKGSAKAEALTARFGSRFCYIGDSPADVAIWNRAESAILTDVAPSVQAKLGEAYIEKQFTRAKWGLKDILKLMRVHQWVKNALLFVPLITSHRMLELQSMLTVAAGFLIFGLWASATYIFNDLLDLEADRAHKSKRRRPLASGRVPLRSGVMLLGLLGLIATVSAPFVDPALPVILVTYLAITLTYSMFLKRKLLADVFVLAGLYCYRILAGGWVADIRISVWLLTFSFLFFMSLAFCKRSSELVNSSSVGTSIARAYTTADLVMVQALGVATSIGAIIEFSLYLTTDTVKMLYPNREFLWLILPIGFFWIARVWMLAARGKMNDDPVVFALKDRMTVLLLFLISGILLASSQAASPAGEVVRRLVQWPA